MATLGFDARVYQIEMTLSSIKDYYNISSKTLTNELDKLKFDFEIKTKELFIKDNERYCDMQDSYFSYSERITDSFTRNFNYSFITLIYSFLESSLNDLCLILKEKNLIELDLIDLRGEGIIRAKTYLTKICKIDFPETHEWNEIIKLNKIRNCIVHANGNIKKSNGRSSLEKSLLNMKTVVIRDQEFLDIKIEYIESMILNIKKFLSKIFRENVEYGFYYQL